MAQTDMADPDGGGEDQRWLGWADWRATLLLVLGILALRIIYLVWLNPWELLHDEAHYWEWSRRLGLSYYSKGPGVAWLIAASTGIFGVSEWAVRLPAALSSMVGALVLARLAIDTTGDERAGFLAALAFNLIPIFQLEGQLMTIDPPFMASWLICGWLGWHAFAAHRRGRSPWLLWGLLGLALGAGFLVKYIIVLLPMGLLIYAIIRRRALPWDRRLTVGVLIVLAGFVIGITPWLAWNAQNGWPAIEHELGHLGAPGGDVPTEWDTPFGGFCTFELLAAQLGVMGPPAFVLIVLATVRAFRRRGERPDRWPTHCYLLCCGLPTVGFFFLVSLVSGVEANWPVSGYLTLLVLVVEATLTEVPEWLRRRRRWREHAQAAQQAGLAAPRKPRSAWVSGWRWMIAWALVTATIVAWPHGWAKLPAIGDVIPMFKISGGRELAEEVDAVREGIRERTREEPLIIVGAYGRASQLAFYLEGRPTVYGAGSRVGYRASQYDYWEATDLSDPSLQGRPAVLALEPAEKWREHFKLRGLETVGNDPPIHVVTDYGGVRETLSP